MTSERPVVKSTSSSAAGTSSRILASSVTPRTGMATTTMQSEMPMPTRAAMQWTIGRSARGNQILSAMPAPSTIEVDAFSSTPAK